MLHYLERKRVSFDTFKCAPDKLNEHLNQYLGCLTCNMAGTVRPGVGRLIHHYLPSVGVALEAGAEPTLKNFEVAGAGSAPTTDWIDELAELGFEDGKTMVSYHSFEELVEKLLYYLNEPATLQQIGLSASKSVLERHTWDHCVGQLQELLVQQGV